MDIPREVEDLINSSGNAFHARVARWFKENGWNVVVSPYYMDQTQTKAREMDLIAEKLWPTSDYRDKPNGHIAVRLFIECKYLPCYSVMWVAQKDQHKAQKLVERFMPLNLQKAQKHHYLCRNPVAKLFASGKAVTRNSDAGKAIETKGGGRKEGTSKITERSAEQDPLYKAVNQVLNGMVSLRDRPVTHPDVAEFGTCKMCFEYPIVVCSSFENMFSVEFFENTVATPMKENFQLEIEYAYTAVNGVARSEYSLIDFVSEDRLGEFEQAVNKDVNAAKKVLEWPR